MKSVSSGSEKAISAVRRTLPATTILPIIFIISVMSTEVIKGSLDLALLVRMSLIPDRPCCKGSGPDATPPNPLIGSPYSLIRE